MTTSSVGGDPKASPRLTAIDFPLELLVKVSFEELDGKTKLISEHQRFPAGEDRDSAEAGWNQSLDKLAQELARGT